jgi:hypothetical protein
MLGIGWPGDEKLGAMIDSEGMKIVGSPPQLRVKYSRNGSKCTVCGYNL